MHSGFQNHLYVNDPRIYISGPWLPSEFQDHRSNCVSDTTLWIFPFPFHFRGTSSFVRQNPPLLFLLPTCSFPGLPHPSKSHHHPLVHSSCHLASQQPPAHPPDHSVLHPCRFYLQFITVGCCSCSSLPGMQVPLHSRSGISFVLPVSADTHLVQALPLSSGPQRRSPLSSLVCSVHVSRGIFYKPRLDHITLRI